MRALFLISLLSLILASQAGEFEFYVFACEWAGSVCEESDCDQDQGVDTEFWNIHGLWPSDGNMTLQYCTDEVFDPNQISNLKEELAQYWNGLYNSPDAFHSHEWAKHGSCANMTQENFFNTVVQLARKLDVYNTLKNAGIVPGNTYDCSDFAQAISNAYGTQRFTLQAQDGAINALELCISGDLEVQDCDDSDTGICSGPVRYPTFSLPSTKSRKVVEETITIVNGQEIIIDELIQ